MVGQNKGYVKMLITGGQFGPKQGGQFALKQRGQFAPKWRGQFGRNIQSGLEILIIPLFPSAITYSIKDPLYESLTRFNS